MAISEFEVSTPAAAPNTIEAPRRMGPVAQRIYNAKVEGAILAGRLDDPRLGIVRQYHDILTQIGDNRDSAPELEQQRSVVFSQGMAQHGIHLDRLTAMFGNQLSEQSAKTD